MLTHEKIKPSDSTGGRILKMSTTILERPVSKTRGTRPTRTRLARSLVDQPRTHSDNDTPAAYYDCECRAPLVVFALKE